MNKTIGISILLILVMSIVISGIVSNKKVKTIEAAAEQRIADMEAGFQEHDFFSKVHKELLTLNKDERMDYWYLGMHRSSYKSEYPDSYRLNLDYNEDILYGSRDIDIEAGSAEELYNKIIEFKNLVYGEDN